MFNKFKNNKSNKLPKYYGGGNSNFDEFGNPVDNTSSTQNIYNEGRNNKISANQYAQAGTAIGMGTMQAFQGYNNPDATSIQKTRGVQAGVDNAEVGVAGAINPALGMAVGAAKKIGSGIQSQVDRTDANGNIINKRDSKMGEIAGGFLDPANSLIGIYTDPNATTGQKIAGALTGGLSDMFTNRHKNQVENSAKANLTNQFPNGGINMQPNAEVEKQENTLNPDGSTTQFDGPSHENGGIPTNLDPGTLIFSDKLKHMGKTFASLNKANNTSKEDKILNDPTASKSLKDTAQLMKEAKVKNSLSLFKIQEELKESKYQSQVEKDFFECGGMVKYKDGGIHIKPENRGKFTAAAKRAGMGVQEYANHILAHKDNYSSTLVKRANFAHNASGWKHEDGGVQKYPNGGIPNVPAGDPRYYTYQGNQVIVPNLNAYTKDTGVATDMGLNNYNTLLNTRAQVRDSKVVPNQTLPKFEYINDPSKGSYDEQFNNYKKVNLGYFEDGGGFGFRPTNRVDKMKIQQAFLNGQNNQGNSSWITPQMLQDNSGYTETPSNPIVKDNTDYSALNQKLYDEELARMNNNSNNQTSNRNNDGLYQIGFQAAQNLGQLAYLADQGKKYDKQNYYDYKPNTLDDTAAIRDANDQARRAEYNVRGASAGNAGTYLSNRVALATQNTINKDRIRKEYANANAGILNQASQLNLQNKYAVDDINARNKGQALTNYYSTLGSLGTNVAQGMKDNKATNTDYDTAELLSKLYNSPETQKMFSEYLKTKKSKGK